MTFTSHLERCSALIVVLTLGSSLAALGQSPDKGQFKQAANMQASCRDSPPPKDGERYLFLTLELDGKPSAERLTTLRRHLEDKSSYSATADWTGVDGLVKLQTENQPLVVKAVPQVFVDDRTLIHRVCLLVAVKSRARGDVHVKSPSGWELTGPSGSQGVVPYTRGADAPEEPPVRGKIAVGYGSGGAGLELNISRALGDLLRRIDDNGIWRLEFSAKTALGTPNDVERSSGADPDASGKVPDALSLDLNRIAYDAEKGPSRMGLRARASGSGEGWEATGYYSPFASQFDGPHGFFGMELEAGYREGDHEFETVTVKAPDRGNMVARVGSVLEWAPGFLGLNRNLAEGLRFYIRGRAWLDYYEDDDGKDSARLAGFLDSELFYNFTGDSRVFLRGEYGKLPPDLTRLTRRIFIGVGQAF